MRISAAAVMTEGFGPRCRMRMVTGKMKTKAKRKAVLSQLSCVSETE
jgi:hypothetical protein